MCLVRSGGDLDDIPDFIELSDASAEEINGTRSVSRLLGATRTTTATPAACKFC
jgi:hypothetical protein